MISHLMNKSVDSFVIVWCLPIVGGGVVKRQMPNLVEGGGRQLPLLPSYGHHQNMSGARYAAINPKQISKKSHKLTREIAK